MSSVQKISHTFILIPPSNLTPSPPPPPAGKPLQEEEISIHLIQRNDTLKVFPGSKIPTDSKVIFGQSYVDESMLSGESTPVGKGVGDEVIGGSMNLSSALHIRVERVGAETALAQIVKLVESAQMAKAPVQKFADHVSGNVVDDLIFLSVFYSIEYYKWCEWEWYQ